MASGPLIFEVSIVFATGFGFLVSHFVPRTPRLGYTSEFIPQKILYINSF